ncbi:MAG TPA: flagellar biosynthesis protein FlhF [bacterium]|nr:flagellar biosynthesis protein FlhF [bacterium]
MRFKTYVGGSSELAHLMDEARQELGPEAVIKTEYFTEGGFFGIGARRMVKVTAGVEEEPGESPFSIPRAAMDRATGPGPGYTPPHAPTPPSLVSLDSQRYGLVGATIDTSIDDAEPELGAADPEVLQPELPAADAPVEPAPAAASPAYDSTVPADVAAMETVQEHAPWPAAIPPEEAPAEIPAPVADEEAVEPFAIPMADIDDAPDGTVEVLQAPPDPTPAAAVDPLTLVLEELRSLRREVDRLKTGRESYVPDTPIDDLSPPVAEAYRRMVDRELSPDLAHSLASDAETALEPDTKASYDAVAEHIIGRIAQHALATAPRHRAPATAPRVLMLIGPTGVGKTTTLSKLAASYALLDNQAVALVTADTYRIAAIDQLKTFAQIINLPLEVVFDPKEFAKAIEVHGHQDVVLVDSAGRSPRDEAKLAELKRFLEISHPVEALLVMAATTKGPDLRLILDRFRPAGLEGLVITKLDETTAVGPVVELLWDTGLPVRYLTNGQNVPDDLIRGDQESLMRHLGELLLR